MDHDKRLGFRVSHHLRTRIEDAGDTSAVARGLLLLGLQAAGDDPGQLFDEASAVLPKITDQRIKRALLENIIGIRSTYVEPMLNNGSEDIPPGDEAEAWDSIGVDI